MNLSHMKIKSDLRGDEPSYHTEIVPYSEAAWATPTPGYQFQWAWRILGLDGSVRATGVSNATEKEVHAFAAAAAQRLHSYRASESIYKLKTVKQRALDAASGKPSNTGGETTD